MSVETLPGNLCFGLFNDPLWIEFDDSNAVHRTSELGAPSHERIVLHFAPSFFMAYSREEQELLLSPFASAGCSNFLFH